MGFIYFGDKWSRYLKLISFHVVIDSPENVSPPQDVGLFPIFVYFSPLDNRMEVF